MCMLESADKAAQNPHCQQGKNETSTNIEFSRTMHDTDGIMPYTIRSNTHQTVRFLYHRRELLEEIEFLTGALESLNEPAVMVVVGAAPGYDLEYLVQIFPSVQFLLYDPLWILPSLYTFSNVCVHRKLFTDEDAQNISVTYSGQKILLQCYTRRSHELFDENLAMIKRWHTILSPYQGAYELTLPYDSDSTTSFVRGTIYYPLWSKFAGSDTRLITDVNTMDTDMLLDHKSHEQHMMFFNTVTRTSRFPHQYQTCGYDQCYDCRAEIHIIQQFIDKFTPGYSLHGMGASIHRHLKNHPSIPNWFTSQRQPPP
jgi:hypothetical protein